MGGVMTAPFRRAGARGLEMNRGRLEPSSDALEDFVVRAATDSPAVGQTADWLGRHFRQPQGVAAHRARSAARAATADTPAASQTTGV